MKRQNLSKLRGFSVIAFDGPEGTEYWCGGADWVTDINHSDVRRLLPAVAMHWMSRFTNRNMRVRAQAVNYHYTLMNWPDLGWVLINPSEVETTIHRVHFVNTTGNGWYMKDEGSTTRKLCMNLSLGVYGELMVHGQKLGKFNVITDGTPFEMSSFTIPTDSNLVYQFEFDTTPVETI